MLQCCLYVPTLTSRACRYRGKRKPLASSQEKVMETPMKETECSSAVRASTRARASSFILLMFLICKTHILLDLYVPSHFSNLIPLLLLWMLFFSSSLPIFWCYRSLVFQIRSFVLQNLHVQHAALHGLQTQLSGETSNIYIYMYECLCTAYVYMARKAT